MTFIYYCRTNIINKMKNKPQFKKNSIQNSETKFVCPKPFLYLCRSLNLIGEVG